MTHKSLLNQPIEPIDVKQISGWQEIMVAMGKTAFQARNLARASDIFQRMLTDNACSVILCLAGSMVSAGQKQVIIDLIEHNMIDAIVATGANIVDQDFFEALGFCHYQGHAQWDDQQLQDNGIDRIYDTLIDEDELRICDQTICDIANDLSPGVYSSREFIQHMGAYLDKNHKEANSVVLSAYRRELPIFVPAFSDCSAGFGLVMQQVANPNTHVSIDSVKDFRELTQLKVEQQETGLLMVGGGVPKNFAQDIVVAAELLGKEAPMHKYAIQITVADERDGALSGSTLREACSWGKVAMQYEQMVFAEASIALPMLVGAAYESKCWQQRSAKRCQRLFVNTAAQCTAEIA